MIHSIPGEIVPGEKQKENTDNTSAEKEINSNKKKKSSNDLTLKHKLNRSRRKPQVQYLKDLEKQADAENYNKSQEDAEHIMETYKPKQVRERIRIQNDPSSDSK